MRNRFILKKRTNKGFTLVEILIAIALAAILLPAVGMILSFSIFSSSQGENFSKAYRLAQEGMEAIVYLKSQNNASWDWVATPGNTGINEFYQPSQSGGVWQLGTKTPSPTVTSEIFTRKIQINSVERCGFAICAIGGILDPHTRKITTHVLWTERDQPQEVKLETYVTAH